MKSPKTKNSHTFEGCKTCRRRHLKCDQTLPRCKRCKLAGLSCDFRPALRWFVSTGPDAGSSSAQNADENTGQFSRRHLFSESSRKSMSSAMVADMPSTITSALNKIDEKARNAESHAEEVAVGPFGVFSGLPSTHESAPRAENTVMTSPTATTCRSASIAEASFVSPITTMSSSMPTYCDDTEPHMDRGDIASSNSAEQVEGSAGMSNALDELFSTSLDFLQWGDLFTWDTEVPGLDSGPLPINSIESHELVNDPSAVWSTANSGDIIDHSGNAVLDGPQTDLDSMAWPEVDWVVDAPALLKHFNEEVINQMGSLPINEKSGWRILNVPSAILTLSHITMFGVDKKEMRHASLANLYGLLAVSAFHLSLNPGAFPALSRPGEYWHFLSDRTYEAAKIHLKISLESETSRNSPSKSKYKEQLMAVGAVLASALLSGNEAESHKYLVEMERLIRVRGLTKPKLSRRARLFHNIYAWMRIVSESTRVHHDESQITLKPLKLASTGLNTPDDNDSGTSRSRQAGSLHNINPDSTLDSFLHLEQFQLQSDSDSRGRRHDDTRDIHLVSSLNCREDMHMRIYGVPETWLRLVSQVTRLANVMDRLSPSQGKSDAETLASLQPKAAYLEEAVCSFKARYQSAAQTESNQSRPHIHMARALSAALVIFFYRRIRNIHPMMLQDSVNQVMDSLHMFDEALQKHGLVGPGTAWPAFIAGAEATGAEQRKSFEVWLSRANAKSGWKGYGVSKDVLKEVWRKRDAAGGVRGSPTWVDVCRQVRRWPLLC